MPKTEAKGEDTLTGLAVANSRAASPLPALERCDKCHTDYPTLSEPWCPRCGGRLSLRS